MDALKENNLITEEKGVKLFHAWVDSPFAHIAIHLANGASIEAIGEKGISHFIEHTIFTGTKKYPSAEEVSNEFKKLSADSNAHTSYNETCFYTTCLIEDFERNYELLLHIFNDSEFFDNEVEREKAPVLSEIRSYDDLANYQLWWNTQKDAYGLFPIPGNADDVKSITSTQIKDFRKRNYLNRKIRIGVRGGVSESSALNAFRNNVPTFNEGDQSDSFFSFTPGKTVYTKENLQEGHYLLMYDIGSVHSHMNDLDRTTMKFIINVLGGSSTSRLFTRIRVKEGLSCYGVGAGVSLERTNGYIWISGQIAFEEMKVFKQMIFEEIANLLPSITEDDLKQFKKMNKMIGFRQMQDGMSHITHTLERDADGLGTSFYNSLLIANSITLDDVRRVGKSVIEKLQSSSVREGIATTGNDSI